MRSNDESGRSSGSAECKLYRSPQTSIQTSIITSISDATLSTAKPSKNAAPLPWQSGGRSPDSLHPQRPNRIVARLVRIRLTMPLPTPKSDATRSRGNRLLSAMRTAPRLNSSVCLITSSVSLDEHYALKRPARKRYKSRSPSRPSRNGPADAATRSCVSNPTLCAFPSRRVDVQSSCVVSIDARVMHGVLPWRPIDSKFHRLYNFMLSRFLISKAAITAS